MQDTHGQKFQEKAQHLTTEEQHGDEVKITKLISDLINQTASQHI
jgi:hypothetical protein